MGILSNPKVPYTVRLVQLGFGIAYLVLICYAGVHRGWWSNINGALAVGGIPIRHLSVKMLKLTLTK